MSRDHACPTCGAGGMNDPTGECPCPWKHRYTVHGSEHPQGIRVDAEEAEARIADERKGRLDAEAAYIRAKEENRNLEAHLEVAIRAKIRARVEGLRKWAALHPEQVILTSELWERVETYNRAIDDALAAIDKEAEGE